MRLPVVPTVDQVRTLPRLLTREVPPEHLDQNGHMNIQHYLGLYDAAGLPFFASIGIGLDYFTERRLGIFDLEHHLWYLAECHAGDRVSVHGRLLARSAKRIHAVWFLVNDTREALSNVFEFVSSHADLEARRTAAFPPDVAERLDRLLDEHTALSWPCPTSGTMSA